jgi:hypothetical protein
MKKEYNKIMDSRLPNILSLMQNNDKHNLQNVDGGSTQEFCASTTVGGCALDYDETDLL